MWVPTKTDHLRVEGEAGGTQLQKVADYDLTGILDESTERSPRRFRTSTA
jgi:hypothetical protein